jgi:hypothetical protein
VRVVHSRAGRMVPKWSPSKKLSFTPLPAPWSWLPITFKRREQASSM